MKSKGNILESDQGAMIAKNSPLGIPTVYNGIFDTDLLPFHVPFGAITPEVGIGAQAIGQGLLHTITTASFSSSTEINNYAYGINLATNPANTANAAIYQTALNFKRALKPKYFFRFRIGSSTSMRFFAGCTNQTIKNTMVGTDNPDFAYFGIQFSTARADTALKFITKKATGQTQHVLDTGVALDTTQVYTLIIDDRSTSFDVYLYNGSMSLLWSTSIADADLPSTTELMGIRMIMETLTNASKNFSMCGKSGVFTRI